MLEAAAQASPSPRLRIRRLLEAAQAFGMGSHLDAARRVLDTLLLEAPDDPCLRADVQRLRARLETMTGGNHHVHRMLVNEAERVLTHDPGRAASLLADAAFIAVMDGELGLSLALARRAESLGTDVDGLAQLEIQRARPGLLLGGTLRAQP
jgi:hypothetical protein